MIWWILLAVLSLWAMVATIRAVRADGLRRVRNAPIVRTQEPKR